MRPMNVVADITLTPFNANADIRVEIDEAHRLLAQTGLVIAPHSHGSTVEGEIDDVMAAVKSVYRSLEGAVVPRVALRLTLGSTLASHMTIGSRGASSSVGSSAHR